MNDVGFSTARAGAEERSTPQARSLFETSFFGVVRMRRADDTIMKLNAYSSTTTFAAVEQLVDDPRAVATGTRDRKAPLFPSRTV